MGIWEAVKKGFGIAGKSLALISVLFFFNLIYSLGSIPLVRPGVVPTPRLVAAAIAFSVVFVLVSIFVQGGAMGVLRDFIKEGALRLGRFAGYSLKYFFRLLGLAILIVLIIGIVGAIAVLIIISAVPLNNIVITGIAVTVAVILGILGIVLVLLFVMSPYALVCEEIGVIASMKRSAAIVKKSFWKVFLLFLVLLVISTIIGFIIGFIMGYLVRPLPVRTGQVIAAVVNSVLNGYLGIVMLGSFMSLYFALSKKEEPRTTGPSAASGPSAAPSAAA